MRFKNQRPVPQDLADGSFVAPDATVELSAEQQKEPHNRRLIDEGVLEPDGNGGNGQPTKDDLRARLDELDAEQPPAKASRDELVAAVEEAEQAAAEKQREEVESQ